MHVPIDHGDTFQPVAPLRVASGDGDVVEQAESAALVRQRVMAGRADERVGVLHRPAEHGVHRRDAPAGSQRPEVEATASDRRHLPRPAVPVHGGLAYARQVVGGMDRGQLLVAGGPRGERGQPLEEAADLEQVAQPPARVRRLLTEVARLDREVLAPGRPERSVAVPQVELVPDDAGAA